MSLIIINTSYSQDKKTKNKSKKTTTSDEILIKESPYKDDAAVVDYYLEGIKALNLDKNPKQASAYFIKALEIDSLYAPANFNISQIVSNVDTAIMYCSKAERIDTSNLWYKYNLAQLLTQKKEFGKAIEICKKILKKDYNKIEVHCFLSIIYDANNQASDGIEVIDSALVVFGDESALLETKQEILINSGMAKEAINNAHKLLSIDSLDSDYLLYTARAYMLQNDSLALTYLRKASQADSLNVNVMLTSCDYYQSKGMETYFFNALSNVFLSDNIPLTAKITYFNDVTNRLDFYRRYYPYVDKLANIIFIKHPSDYQANRLYAEHLIKSGELDKALDIYKKYANDTIPNKEELEKVIGIELYKKDTISVIQYTKKAVELFPDNKDFLLNYIGILSLQGDNQQALKLLMQEVKKENADSILSVYYGNIGDIYHQTDKKKLSYKYYNKALTLNPENIMVLNNYSYFLSVDGVDLEKALSMSSKVLSYEPSNPTYIDTYAWILYKLERYKEAKTHMQKAVALDMNSSKELLIHYGDILFKLGETSNAKIYWKKALEKGADKQDIESRLKDLGE